MPDKRVSPTPKHTPWEVNAGGAIGKQTGGSNRDVQGHGSVSVATPPPSPAAASPLAQPPELNAGGAIGKQTGGANRDVHAFGDVHVGPLPPSQQSQPPLKPSLPSGTSIGGLIGEQGGGQIRDSYGFGNVYVGTTSEQVLKQQLKIPTFSSSADKQKFLAALEEIFQLAKGDVAAIVMPTIVAASRDAMTDLSRIGDVRISLADVKSKAVSIKARLHDIFQRHSSYRSDLEQALPPNSEKMMDDFITALAGYERELDVLARVRQEHPDEGARLRGMAAAIEPYALAVRTTIPGRIVAVANERIPYMKKALE